MTAEETYKAICLAVLGSTNEFSMPYPQEGLDRILKRTSQGAIAEDAVEEVWNLYQGPCAAWDNDLKPPGPRAPLDVIDDLEEEIATRSTAPLPLDVCKLFDELRLAVRP